MYEDCETGYKIREIDFDKREEIEIYVKLADIYHREGRKHGAYIKFPMEWATCFCLGYAMKNQYTRKDRWQYWIILDKDNNAVGCAATFPIEPEFVSQLGDIYPIISVLQNKDPYDETIADVYCALARMFKDLGRNAIFYHTLFNHPMEAWLKPKRKIGSRDPQKPTYVLWEMNI